jgi:hypothetical protein
MELSLVLYDMFYIYWFVLLTCYGSTELEIRIKNKEHDKNVSVLLITALYSMQKMPCSTQICNAP